MARELPVEMLDTANPEMHLAPKKCLAYVLFFKNLIHFFFSTIFIIQDTLGTTREKLRAQKS